MLLEWRLSDRVERWGNIELSHLVAECQVRHVRHASIRVKKLVRYCLWYSITTELLHHARVFTVEDLRSLKLFIWLANILGSMTEIWERCNLLLNALTRRQIETHSIVFAVVVEGDCVAWLRLLTLESHSSVLWRDTFSQASHLHERVALTSYVLIILPFFEAALRGGIHRW